MNLLALPSHRSAAASSRHAGRTTAGFTLLELLLVVAIMVIIGGIALPSVTEGMRRHRLQASASMIAGKLTETRINALKRNRPTWLLIEPDARRVRVQTLDAGGSAVDLGVPGALSEGVVFGAVPAQVAYDSMGRLTAVQTIDVTAGGGSRRVTVGLTGSATID